ncbi:hypothetical protein [Aeromicrobium sp. UC242_57]|uniref:hypothetical protein n=1 Tax=Aeromicrobium sp. UC242_57 TaxID=3374624 RepID=UPI0037B28937
MRANKFAGDCSECGVLVMIGAGRLIGFPGRWRTICAGCSPTPPPRGDHAGWHHAGLASLDFETTGIDPLTDRVPASLCWAIAGTTSAGSSIPASRSRLPQLLCTG